MPDGSGEPLNVHDYERLAEAALEPGPWGYFAGGADDERTLADNVAAWSRWQLRPRMLVDVAEVSTRTTVLGHEVSMPLLVAPTAFHRVCHADGEPGTARAAAAAGTVYTLSTLATSAPAEVADAAPDGQRWFQLYCYRDPGITRALIEQAIAAGFTALVLTVDAPGVFGRRERDLRTGFEVDVAVPSVSAGVGREDGATPAEIGAMLTPSLTWHDLEQLAGSVELPLLVKGVMTAEDARLAQEHGAAGVVVSNHGARQLDGVAATADVLPEVVEAVEDDFTVLIDGGVRRGTDVLKALALGADAAMAGRAVLWGLAAGGEQGVAHVLELLRAEIELGLRLIGCTSPAELGPGHIQRARA